MNFKTDGGAWFLLAVAGLIALVVSLDMAVRAIRRYMASVDLNKASIYRYKGSPQLYLYEQAMNRCGHRSARQDWWCEVAFDDSGSLLKVGGWVKDNVGYDPKPDQEWCHPYRKICKAELLEAKLAAAKLLQAPKGGLLRALNSFCA